MTISGSCHCGAVEFTFSGEPEFLLSCNCSLCRRLGALWAHAPRSTIDIHATDDATIAYIQGDKTLATHSCKNCGCTTHWLSLQDDDPDARTAVNFRCCAPEVVDALPVRRFDGADSWTFLD